MKAVLLFSAVASVSLVTGLGAQVTPGKADSTCTKYSDGRTECRVIRRGVGDSAFRRFTYRMDSTMEKRAASVSSCARRARSVTRLESSLKR